MHFKSQVMRIVTHPHHFFRMISAFPYLNGLTRKEKSGDAEQQENPKTSK